MQVLLIVDQQNLHDRGGGVIEPWPRLTTG